MTILGARLVQAVLACGLFLANPGVSASKINYDVLQRSIVRIQSVMSHFDWFRPWQATDGGQSIGSGFIVQTEPYILIATNQHVINDASQVTIQMLLRDETEWQVNVVAACPKFDVALLTLQNDKAFKDTMKQAGIELAALTLSGRVAKMGQDVIALGFPLGQNSMKVSKGNVAGNEIVNENICIQSTAPISPGNSGGPLLDEAGKEVVGINFAKSTTGENVNYVIPAWRVQALVNKHRRDQPKVPPSNGSWQRLGFRTPGHGLSTMQPSAALYGATKGCHQGTYISKVSASGFVSKAQPEVKKGSMLVSVAGKKIDAFGKAMVPKLMSQRVAIDDLFYASKDLDMPVELETCSEGTIQKHYVSTVWTEDFGKGIINQEEPVVAGLHKEYEIFGDLGVMQMTSNHVVQAFSRSGSPQITRWLLPDRAVKPRLMIIYARPGSYIADVIPEGAAVEKVNGKTVRTLEEFREALIPDEPQKTWTLQTDLGLIAALPFEETLVTQLQRATLMPYLATQGVMGAAQKLGLLDTDDEKEEEAEPQTEEEVLENQAEPEAKEEKKEKSWWEWLTGLAQQQERTQTGLVQMSEGKAGRKLRHATAAAPKMKIRDQELMKEFIDHVNANVEKAHTDRQAAGPVHVVEAKHRVGLLVEGSDVARADSLEGAMAGKRI